jgi:integrase
MAKKLALNIIGEKSDQQMKIQKVDLFAKSIKSPATRANYTITLRKFKKDMGVDDLRNVAPKDLQNMLIQYVVALVDAGRSYSRQNGYICAIKAYCEAYDIEGINWLKVWKYTSEAVTPHNDKPYTREELTKMLSKANARARAIILLMMSSGMRIGALEGLKRKHLEVMDGFGGYKITVYADSPKDHYTTFCTPEARKAIEAYFAERQNRPATWTYKGKQRLKRIQPETITDESPVFRLERSEVTPITTVSASDAITSVAVAVGIRPLIKKEDRHKTPATHSLRKIANTAFVRAKVMPVVVEMFLGHKTGLQQNYLRLTEQELLAEYVKAVDLLTIGEEDGLKRENERLTEELVDKIELRRRLLIAENNIVALEQVIRNISKEKRVELGPAFEGVRVEA